MSYIVNGYEDNGYRGETTRVVVPCFATRIPDVYGTSSIAFGHEYPVPYTVFGQLPETGLGGINTATRVVVVASTSSTPPALGWAPVASVPEFKLWNDAAQGRDFAIWGMNCGAFANYATGQIDTYSTGWTTGMPRIAVAPAIAEIGISGFANITLGSILPFCDDPTATITVTIGAVEKFSDVYGGNESTSFALADCNELGLITIDIAATNGVGTVELSTFGIIQDNSGNCGPS